jgi:hypothetical protein
MNNMLGAILRLGTTIGQKIQLLSKTASLSRQSIYKEVGKNMRKWFEETIFALQCDPAMKNNLLDGLRRESCMKSFLAEYLSKDMADLEAKSESRGVAQDPLSLQKQTNPGGLGKKTREKPSLVSLFLQPTQLQSRTLRKTKSQTPSQQASKNQPKSQTPGELVVKTAEKNSALRSQKTQIPPSQTKIKKKIREKLEKPVAGNVWPLYIVEKNKRYRLQQAKLQPKGMVFLQIKKRKTKIGKSDAERWIETLQAAKKAKKLKKTTSLYFSQYGFTKGALAIFAKNQVHAIAA